MTIHYWGVLTLVACLAGCTNPSVSTIRDTKAAPLYVPQKPVTKQEQPRKEPDTYRETDSGRTYSLTLKNADIKDVLLLLSRESGIPIIAERGLAGAVRIEAQNKKLGEILYAILKPLGYTATIENGVIMVGRPQLSTRTFRVNYIKDKRNSSSNMNVSGFTAAGNSGSVSVSTEGKSDFWGALESSLELLVFGSSNMGKREGGAYIRGEAEKKIEKGTTDKAGVTDTGDPLISSTQITEGKLKQLLVNEIAGIIQVTDYPENLDKIAAFLADVEEGSKRQVLIQAHIMEVSLKDSFSLGIDWKVIFDKAAKLTLSQALSASSISAFSSTTASNVFKISAGDSHFALLLDAMKEQGYVNMLSSPKITALNNQKAVIKLTTKQVSWVSSKTTNNSGGVSNETFTTTPQVDEVGIFLDVTPQIGLDGAITMQIHPSVSEIKEISTSPDKTSNKPIIDVREIDTMVDARAGETIVIAGLISDKLSETKRSLPMLGDIPYLGTLFSYNAQDRIKAELVIMMTPYVLNAKSIEDIRKEHEQRIRNMGGTFHLINNLGSMVSEKTSRDAKQRNEPLLQAPSTPPDGRATEISSSSEQPTVPDSVGPAQKKNEPLNPAPLVQQPAATPATPAPPAAPSPAVSVQLANPVPVAPPALRQESISPEVPVVTSTKRSAPVSTVPELRAIRGSKDSIQLDLANFNGNAEVLREKKARRVIVKLPGVLNKVGQETIQLDHATFSRVRVARHPNELWVVLHSSLAQLPTIREQVTGNTLSLEILPDVAPRPPRAALKLEQETAARSKVELPSSSTPEDKSAAARTVPPPARLELPAVSGRLPADGAPARQEVRTDLATVKTVSVTSDREQTLYRSAVTAYKIGDCTESIKLFDSFIKLYPESPFTSDAAYYHKDCSDRLGVISGKRN